MSFMVKMVKTMGEEVGATGMEKKSKGRGKGGGGFVLYTLNNQFKAPTGCDEFYHSRLVP